VNALADYRARAERHRPQSVEQLFEAVDELAAQGLTQIDISTALKIPLASVIQHLYSEDYAS
jgi:hypothetical protein